MFDRIMLTVVLTTAVVIGLAPISWVGPAGAFFRASLTVWLVWLDIVSFETLSPYVIY